MMTNIKMCGIQLLETAAVIPELDIQYVGLIFAPSRRQMTLPQARGLISTLRAKRSLRITGVFRNQQQSVIDEAMNALRLDVIQLHGDETERYCQEVKQKHHVLVMKVISLAGAPTSEDIIQRMTPYKNTVDLLMLDTHDPKYGGGAGKVFRWDVIPDVRKWVHEQGLSLFVAGGLDEQNVEGLIQRYHPDGVDISSGIETDGRKDIQKMKAFIERVRRA